MKNISQMKYDECLALLSELHELSYMMIETGLDEELSPIELIEEALRVIRAVDGSSKAGTPSLPKPSKKEKKLLH
jgi:hypothetical protein